MNSPQKMANTKGTATTNLQSKSTLKKSTTSEPTDTCMKADQTSTSQLQSQLPFEHLPLKENLSPDFSDFDNDSTERDSKF